jgi:hypothetical protein
LPLKSRPGVLDALGPHATPIFLIQSGGLWHSAGCALCITSGLLVTREVG